MSAERASGYKQTQIGLIPYDWDLRRIGEVSRIEGGLAFSSKKFTARGIYQVLKMSNLYEGGINLERSASFLSALDDIEEKYLINNNDVLLTLTGTTGKRDYGYSAIIRHHKNLLLNQRVARLIAYSNCHPEYLAAQLKFKFFISQFFDISKGGTGNQTNVSTSDVAEIYLPFPDRDEQEKIASSLFDLDALISGIEQLLVKKRDIQQATMQELLTGQRRLPGFSGVWEMKRLGEIGEISGAGVDKKIRTEETEVTLLNYTDVYKNDFLRSTDFNHVVTAKPEQISRCGVKKGDVFFTPTSEVRDDIGHAAVSCEDMPGIVYSYHVVRLRPTIESNIKFLGFVFKSKEFKDQASTLCEGSGTRYVITLPKFRAMKIFLPLDVSEQAAIGEILFEMSREIFALEARRDKARMLKQGMMQELLTGRIRLTNQGN